MMNRAIIVAALCGALLAGCATPDSQTASTPTGKGAPKMKMRTNIPPEITTPDSVETRFGTLKFFDGLPDKATVEMVYDNLDFQRGVQAFLTCIPGASLLSVRNGIRRFGPDNETIVLFEDLMDSKSLFLTANTESVYAWGWLNLKDGPMVLESPPNVLGVIDDFWFRNVIDFGNTGPDKGQGGKFLIVPPGYKGDIPTGYFVARSPTINNLLVWRGYLVDGSPKPSVDSVKKHVRIYPLGKDASASKVTFVNGSGKEMNTVHANNSEFYEEVNELVQDEPVDAMDPETMGLLAAIGIEKGKPFAPDARMQKILSEAAAVGNATARAITFRSRDKAAWIYGPSSSYFTPFVGGSHEFLHNGARNLEARTLFYYPFTIVTPAMALKMVGRGSQYGILALDSEGNYLDGSKNYKVHLPPNVPAKDFWSFVVYDPQTRSMLQTDKQFPGLNSANSGVVPNADGSIDLYFGPTAPPGKEKNWLQTVPGKGFFTGIRLYGPLQSWFDQTWRPGEIELVK